jgi:hypothetical protein
MILVYHPGLEGDVYLSPVISQDFPIPRNDSLTSFLETPLGIWTALTCTERILDKPACVKLKVRHDLDHIYRAVLQSKVRRAS